MPKYYRPTTRADALAALAEGARRRAAAGRRHRPAGRAAAPHRRADAARRPQGRHRPARADRRRPTTACGSAPRTRWASWSRTPSSGSGTRRSSRPRSPSARWRSATGPAWSRNSCNASPAADTAPPLLVHGARVTIASLDGDRTASLDEFFLGPRRTLCGPGELVTRIDLPRPAPGSGLGLPPAHPPPRRRPRDGQRRGGRRRRRRGWCSGMGAVGPRPLRAELRRPGATSPTTPRSTRPSTSCCRSPPRSPTSGAAASTGSRRSASSPSARSSPRPTAGTPRRWRHDHQPTTSSTTSCRRSRSPSTAASGPSPSPRTARCSTASATRSGCPAPRAAAPRASAAPAPCCSTAGR